jgi:hypothetical protein
VGIGGGEEDVEGDAVGLTAAGGFGDTALEAGAGGLVGGVLPAGDTGAGDEVTVDGGAVPN